MNRRNLNEAVKEARKFIKRAEELEDGVSKLTSYTSYSEGTTKYLSSEDYRYNDNPKESGALRRSSMELTRALAKLRNG